MKPVITISISGKTGSGKSIVALAISQALGELGCERIKVVDDNNLGVDETYTTFIRGMKHPNLVKKVLSKTPIEIKTIQRIR